MNRATLDQVLVSVQKTRRDSSGALVATVLDGRGGIKDLRLGPGDAEAVERIWARSQFDLDRYAALPLDFPVPAAIPAEISDAAV